MKRPFDAKTALERLVRECSSDRFDIAIDYHGKWYYQGSRIDRIELVKLFTTVLHRAVDGSYWLITPVERGRIEVADAPFVLVDLELSATLSFRDNIDRVHVLDKPEKFYMRTRQGQNDQAPYLDIGGGVEARMATSVFYELCESAIERSGEFGIVSSGHFFALGSAE